MSILRVEQIEQLTKAADPKYSQHSTDIMPTVHLHTPDNKIHWFLAYAVPNCELKGFGGLSQTKKSGVGLRMICFGENGAPWGYEPEGIINDYSFRPVASLWVYYTVAEKLGYIELDERTIREAAKDQKIIMPNQRIIRATAQGM